MVGKELDSVSRGCGGSPSRVIRRKSFPFSEAQFRRIPSWCTTPFPAKRSGDPVAHQSFALKISWFLEVDGNPAKLRGKVSYSTVLPLTFRANTSCMFFFAEDIQCGNSNSSSLWPSLGMCFFKGMVVKEQLKGYISKVVDSCRISTKLSLPFMLLIGNFRWAFKCKVKYCSEASFYKPAIFLAAIV